MRKSDHFAAWLLKIGDSLEFGAWILEFPLLRLSDALRNNFFRGFDAFAGWVGVDGGWAVARDVSGEGAAFEDVFQDFPDTEGQAIGLGDAFDFWFAIARPQNSRELTIAVNSLVVHFDNDDAFVLWPDLFQAIR